MCIESRQVPYNLNVESAYGCKRTGTTILECLTLALHASDQPSMTGVDFPRTQGMHDLILIAGWEASWSNGQLHQHFRPAQLKHPILGHTISDGDRVGLEGDKTADLHPAPVSNQSTSARSEPASSTLLTPWAHYHKFAASTPTAKYIGKCPQIPGNVNQMWITSVLPLASPKPR